MWSAGSYVLISSCLLSGPDGAVTAICGDGIGGAIRSGTAWPSGMTEQTPIRGPPTPHKRGSVRRHGNRYGDALRRRGIDGGVRGGTWHIAQRIRLATPGERSDERGILVPGSGI